MGSICHKSEDRHLKNYNRQSIDSDMANEAIKFTTSISKHTEGDALMLFVDTNHRIEKNQCLAKINSHLGSKVQQYLEIYLQSNKLLAGDCAVLNVDIHNLYCKCLVILCIEVCTGLNDVFKQLLLSSIERCLAKAHSEKIQKIDVSQLNQQLGVPKQTANRILLKALTDKKGEFSSITVFCLSKSSLNAFKQMSLQMNNSKRVQPVLSMTSEKSSYF